MYAHGETGWESEVQFGELLIRLFLHVAVAGHLYSGEFSSSVPSYYALGDQTYDVIYSATYHYVCECELPNVFKFEIFSPDVSGCLASPIAESWLLFYYSILRSAIPPSSYKYTYLVAAL